ncbi:exonuclease domain-containing protein [Curtobacterium sp. MCLR17_032]|uniref:exonuclease domain-containing protein n=1 Tax=Curtobacterium sp. MCLR17_032 TaxID=2175650 RepID=UPI000DAA0AC6|nr:exonuclease domain-containing protein [Curtobacterium sp. MCLR17_032]WIE62766.1 exonuclease domain-containing protein [Curtobacterium sp. MCLR17_032]
MHNGYAVIDLETTGLAPSYGHRIIEIGIVHVTPDGDVERTFETVVNPERDLGPVHIHRLRGADMTGAPTFADIAGDLIDKLRGRVVVAHNASFEARFLHAEFERLGHRSPFKQASTALCTMRLAQEFLPGSGRKLADCCSAYDIELVDAHEALADARATASLLGAYIGSSRQDPRWTTWGTRATELRWPGLPSGTAPWTARRRSAGTADRTRVDVATDRLPAVDGGAEATLYAAVLDRALSDDLMTANDADQLASFGREFGLREQARADLHRRYFADLVEAVWAGGVLTIQDHIQLERVARLLGVTDDELEHAVHSRQPARMGARSFSAATQAAPAPVAEEPAIDLGEGSIVTLTGEMRRSRTEIEADLARLGIRSAPNVTKKTAVLIAADVDSLSGKARKARQYGIPIIEEDVLEAALAAAR